MEYSVAVLEPAGDHVVVRPPHGVGERATIRQVAAGEERHAAQRGDAEVAAALTPLAIDRQGLVEQVVAVLLLVTDVAGPGAALALLRGQP